MTRPSDRPREAPGDAAAVPWPTVMTPFGAVRLGIEGLPRSAAPVKAELLPSGARTVRGVGDGVEVDLVCGPFEGSVPDGYPPLDSAWGAVWHVHARRRLSAFRLSAGLDQVPVSCTAAPDEGQHLCAVSVDDGTTELTIGGADEEALWERSRAGDHLPRWWARTSYAPWTAGWDATQVPSTGALDRARGVFWDVPGLEPGEECVVHAAVAWSALDVERPTTWYAVDVETRWLLDELVSPPRGEQGSRPSRPGPSA